MQLLPSLPIAIGMEKGLGQIAGKGRGEIMSQITTHILDTTKGRPAQGVAIILYQGITGGILATDDYKDEETDIRWKEISRGITNTDGRIADLLKNDIVLQIGIYKMRFETENYFAKDNVITFYPYVEIVFDITTNEHYHIPLLINPFAYNTYKGS